MVKHALSVIIGTITGMLCIVFMEMGIHYLYPLPPGTDMYDADSLEKAMNTMPRAVFVLILVSYVIASFIAGITATLVAKRTKRSPSLICGIIMTIAGIINVLSVHHPLWFSIANCFAYIPFCYLGYLTTRKKGSL